MPETAYLALLFDGPLQSWGFDSRFQRRTTGMHPSKSGVLGLICAAMGLAKGSPGERDLLPELAALKMTTIAMPRAVEGTSAPSPVRRLEDFHTVLETRRASGAMNNHAVVTHRQYLTDAHFGVILEGKRPLLEKVAAAVQDPCWGVWLGRKTCIPAEPLCRGLFSTLAECRRALIGEAKIETFTTVSDVDKFEDGTDSINDCPVSFGDGTSSGPDKRRFQPRRIRLEPARR